MKKITLLLLLGLMSITSYSQDFFVKANFVSAYLWRGLNVGGPCIQPSLGVTWKGLTLNAWASTELGHKCNEIDMTLTYENKGFFAYINDVFVQEGDAKFNFFNYKNQSTNHCIEVGAGYTIHPKFPLRLTWYTMVAGKDWDITTDEAGEIIDKDRRWSSYFEMIYPFNFKGVGIALEAGIAPWKSTYAEKFNVVNVSVEVSKVIPITQRFSLPIAGKLMFNPDSKQTHFAVKLSI